MSSDTLLARITDKLTMFLFQSTVVPSLPRYRDTVCLVLLRYVDFRLTALLAPMAALQNYFLTWKIGNSTRLGHFSGIIDLGYDMVGHPKVLGALFKSISIIPCLCF